MRNFQNISNIKKSGFSLIEVLIASVIFTVAMIIATSIFVSSNRAQAKTRVSRNLVEQTRFAMETMVRDIRLAKKYAPGPLGWTFTLNDDKTVSYSRSNNEIVVTRDGVTKRLTDSSQVIIDNFEFSTSVLYLDDPAATPNRIQPYIHIKLKASAARADSSRPETQQSYQLETTVSLRNYIKLY